MELQTINLWPDGSAQNDKDPAKRQKLTIFRPANKPAGPVPAIVVCPGGGYGGLAAHEGAPFAELFARHGMVGIVLNYRVSPNRFPAPQADACRAIRLVRSMAQNLGVDDHKVGIMGFSAGGHLAATTATQPDLHKEKDDDLVDKFPARPDVVILGYPVVSMTQHYHRGSAANLLGDRNNDEMRRRMSNELHVTDKNPPALIFHTADDGGVPVQNAMMFAQACWDKKVKAELHVYETGPHGVGMALNNPKLKSWTGLVIDWLGAWATK